MHPFIKLLEMGADVIIGGRCGDICFTAAPCIRAGFPEALAYHMGKMIECASLVAEPFMGKETVIGAVSHETSGSRPIIRRSAARSRPRQGIRCMSARRPYSEYTLGGTLDMSDCRYEQFDERTAASPARTGSLRSS